MTPLQHRCLDMISSYITEKGYAPSIREVARSLGIAISGTFSVISALVRQGHLVRTNDKQRNLRLARGIWRAEDLSGVSTEALRAELERRGV